MDRQWLEDRAVALLHRSFSSDDYDAALLAVELDCGVFLRSQANQTVLEVAEIDWTDPYQLDPLFRQMLSVEYAGLGGTVYVQAKAKAYLDRYASGGAPYFYAITAGRLLYVAPYAARDFTLTYFQQPTAIGINADSTNEVLTAYPTMYLNRFVQDLAMISQDVQLVQSYSALFLQSVVQINEQTSAMSMGDAPTMGDI